ncbi:MAG: transporter substrate-binding protein [Rhodopila sp.]|nr:transporter substrate-binding protein [Rhodopila sp.]
MTIPLAFACMQPQTRRIVSSRLPTGRAMTVVAGIVCLIAMSASSQAWATDAISPACKQMQAKYPQLKGKTPIDAASPYTPVCEAFDPRDPSKYDAETVPVASA